MNVKRVILYSLILFFFHLPCSYAFTWNHPERSDIEKNNCLFDWLEYMLPDHLVPAPQPTKTTKIEGHKTYYRCYSKTNSCIAAFNDKLHYASPDTDNEILSFGALTEWYLDSACLHPELKLYKKKYMFDGSEVEKKWKEVGLPYFRLYSSRANLIGSDIISHGKFKLKAVGAGFTITSITSRDLLNNTWTTIDGLGPESTSLDHGDELVFEILSGHHNMIPTKPKFSFSVENKGEVFRLTNDLKSYAYPFPYIQNRQP